MASLPDENSKLTSAFLSSRSIKNWWDDLTCRKWSLNSIRSKTLPGFCLFSRKSFSGYFPLSIGKPSALPISEPRRELFALRTLRKRLRRKKLVRKTRRPGEHITRTPWVPKISYKWRIFKLVFLFSGTQSCSWRLVPKGQMNVNYWGKKERRERGRKILSPCHERERKRERKREREEE